MQNSGGSAGLLQVAEGSLASLDGLVSALFNTIVGFDVVYKRCNIEDLHSALLDTLSQCIHNVSSMHAAAAAARRAMACDSALRVQLAHLEQEQQEQRDRVERLEGRLADGRAEGALLAAVCSCPVFGGWSFHVSMYWVPHSVTYPTTEEC
jgi:hypothetical protein